MIPVKPKRAKSAIDRAREELSKLDEREVTIAPCPEGVDPVTYLAKPHIEKIGKPSEYSGDLIGELDMELRDIGTYSFEVSVKKKTHRRPVVFRRGAKVTKTVPVSETLRPGYNKDTFSIPIDSLSQEEANVLNEIYLIRTQKKNVYIQAKRLVELERELGARLLQLNTPIRLGDVFRATSDGELYRLESVVVYTDKLGFEVRLTFLASKCIRVNDAGKRIWSKAWYEFEYGDKYLKWVDRSKLKKPKRVRGRISKQDAVEILEKEYRALQVEFDARQEKFLSIQRRLVFLEYGIEPGSVLRVKVGDKWLRSSVKVISVEGFKNGSITVRGVEQLFDGWVSETLAKTFSFQEDGFKFWR